MAARLWRWLLGCEVALGAALGAALWALSTVSPQTATATALAVAFCTPGILVVASFCVSLLVARPKLTIADLGYILRALVTEVVDFNVAILAMMATPRTAHRAAAINTNVSVRPLLLIHGIVCNRGVWEPWLQGLREAGFGPIRLLDLEPPLADIEVHALRVERELRCLQQQSAGRRVDIIAHSMGGLVARAALRHAGHDLVGHIVTIGSPHHGTWLARLFPWPPLRQMCPDAGWLRVLNGGWEAHHPEVTLTSIYSLEDNLIVPAESAVLEHARRIELRGVGHLGLLSSRQVFACTLAALRNG